MNNQNFVGEIIKEQRKTKGITQKELASLLNVSDKAVSKWERGESYPEITLFPCLADIFDISIDMLMTGEENSSYQNVSPTSSDISQLLYQNLDTKISMAAVFMSIFFTVVFTFNLYNNSFLYLSIAVTVFLGIFLLFYEKLKSEQLRLLSRQRESENTANLLGYFVFLSCSFGALLFLSIGLVAFVTFPVFMTFIFNDLHLLIFTSAGFGAFFYIGILVFPLNILFAFLVTKQKMCRVRELLPHIFLMFLSFVFLIANLSYKVYYILSNPVKMLRNDHLAFSGFLKADIIFALVFFALCIVIFLVLKKINLVFAFMQSCVLFGCCLQFFLQYPIANRTSRNDAYGIISLFPISSFCIVSILLLQAAALYQNKKNTAK